MHYEFENPAALADFLEQKNRDILLRLAALPVGRSKRDEARERARAEVFREVAELIRKSTFNNA